MNNADEKSGPRRHQGSRRDTEPPAAIAEWGWRYHHMGIPTDKPRSGERYLEEYKMYVSGFESSPYGVEWMRFEEDSPVSKLLQTTPHIAFEVDDLEKALEGKELIGEPDSPSGGIKVAMILHNGTPVELLEFGRDGDLRTMRNRGRNRSKPPGLGSATCP